MSEVLWNAQLAVKRDPVRMRLESSAGRASLIMLRAIRLAPTLEVCEAILRGERVPVSRLDPKWAEAYALR